MLLISQFHGEKKCLSMLTLKTIGENKYKGFLTTEDRDVGATVAISPSSFDTLAYTDLIQQK